MATSSNAVKSKSVSKMVKPPAVMEDSLELISEAEEMVKFTVDDLLWEVHVVKPPGIATITQWGEMVIPEGKYKGKTLEEARQDVPYEKFMAVTRKLTTPWAINLQRYFVACRRKIVEGCIRNLNAQELEEYQQTASKTKTKAFQGSNKLKAESPNGSNKAQDEDKYEVVAGEEFVEDLIGEMPEVAEEATRLVNKWSYHERAIMLQVLRRHMPFTANMFGEDMFDENRQG